jgi:hypothetical protein
MACINLDPDFPTHPKCIRLQVKCGKNSHLLLIPLWCFAAKYHPEDGDLGSYSPEEIESFCAWAGEKQCFYNACVEIGFIDVKGNKKLLHNWKERQGHIVAYRERSRLAATTRWDKIRHNNINDKRLTSNAPSIRQAVQNDAQAQVLNQALPYIALPTSKTLNTLSNSSKTEESTGCDSIDKTKSPKPKPDPRVNKLFYGWCSIFEKHNGGGKYPATFGKDQKLCKDILGYMDKNNKVPSDCKVLFGIDLFDHYFKEQNKTEYQYQNPTLTGFKKQMAKIISDIRWEKMDENEWNETRRKYGKI